MKKLLAVLLSAAMTMALTVPAFAAPAPGAAVEDVIPISAPVNTQDIFDAQKEALGGVPGQIGVMVNGEYIQFTDAVPEAIDGRTMVPLRMLMETLDGKVSASGSNIICELDGTTFTFAVGSSRVTVEYSNPANGGETESGFVDMGCAPYIRAGRTYVPVRFIGEALGYTVGWDNDFKTAVYFDADAMAEEIDQKFTVLNRMLSASAPMEEGKNYSAELKGDMTFTAFDTINGNQTYTAAISGKQLMNTQAASGTYSVTMSDNTADLILEQLELDGEDAELMRGVLKGMKDMELIMTKEGLAWFHAPALDELGGQENIWCGLPMEEDAAKASFDGAALTIGRVMAMAVEPDSAMSWSGIAEAVDAMALVMGDERFTTSNGTSTLTVDADTLDPDGELGVKDLFKELKLTLKVDGKGGAVLTCRVETEAQSGMPALRLSLDAQQDSQSSSMTMDAHVANLGQLKLTLNATQKTTNEKPMIEPPAGASIIDAPKLLNS